MYIDIYILKALQLTNLLIYGPFILRRGYFSDPMYVHPYESQISFSS